MRIIGRDVEDVKTSRDDIVYREKVQKRQGTLDLMRIFKAIRKIELDVMWLGQVHDKESSRMVRKKKLGSRSHQIQK